MNVQNAFIGHAGVPTAAEVDTALGSAAPLWHELVAWAHSHGAEGEEWKSGSVKHGWSLRLQHKKRNIIYLVPAEGCMGIAFILSDRALAAAKQAHLPKHVLEELEHAPRYPEGNGLRLTVRRHGDLAAIEKLAAIKLAN
jgi:hypothetical protein